MDVTKAKTIVETKLAALDSKINTETKQMQTLINQKCPTLKLEKALVSSSEKKLDDLKKERQSLQDQLTAYKAEERSQKVAKFCKRGEEVISESFDIHLGAQVRPLVEIVKEAGILINLIEDNLNVWTEQVRIDWPKVEIVDPAWLEIKHEGKPKPWDPIYEHLPYQTAIRLKNSGKVRILEEEPQYEIRYRRDPDPPVLEQLYKIGFGVIQSAGKTLPPDLERLRRRMNVDVLELNVNTFLPFLTQEEIDEYEKRLDEN
jgi:hypothetical protein